MIEQVRGLWEKWKPWQLSLFGFALSWWLLLAPSTIRWVWPLLGGSRVPQVLGWLQPISYLLLAVGGGFSLLELSSPSLRVRHVSMYFVLGLLSMGLLGSLGLIPVEIF